MKTDPSPATGTAFGKTLADLSRGAALSECSEALQSIVKAVKETGLKGVLNIKINVELSKDEDTVQLTPEITAKIPKQPIKATIFFATDDFILTREDPRQHEMNFGVVDGGKITEAIKDAIQSNQVK